MQVKRALLPRRIADTDLRLLRLFKVVADCGGLAAAEVELNLSLSSISRQLSELEDRLGLVLCKRGRAGFSLTTEGAEVYRAVERLLAATEGFRNSINSLHHNLTGEINAGLFENTSSHPDARMPRAISLFAAAAPEARLNLHVGSITRIEQGVLGGQFAVGLLPTTPRHESLHYDPLFIETMHLYVGKEHPFFADTRPTLGWDDIRGLRLAALAYQSPNLTLMHERQLQRAASASDQEAVLVLVLSGCYAGFLPTHMAAPFVQQNQLRALAPDRISYTATYHCIRRREIGRSRLADALHRAVAAAHLPALG